MTDVFAGRQSGLESPATDLYEIVPDDAADLSLWVRAITATEPGTVRVTAIGGSAATLYVGAGSVLPVRVRKVWATGTTAAGVVGLV